MCPCVRLRAGEIVTKGHWRHIMSEAELIARITELEAKLKDVEGANPLLSHSGHLAVSRKWLEELSRLKAQLANLNDAT